MTIKELMACRIMPPPITATRAPFCTAQELGPAAVGGHAHRRFELRIHLQRGEEGLLRDLHLAELAHPFLPSFCFSRSLRLRVMSPP